MPQGPNTLFITQGGEAVNVQERENYQNKNGATSKTTKEIEPSFAAHFIHKNENYRAGLATNTQNSNAPYITCQLHE